MSGNTRGVHAFKVKMVQESGRENKVGGGRAAGVEGRGMHIKVAEKEKFAACVTLPDSQEFCEQRFPKKGPGNWATRGVGGIEEHNEQYITDCSAARAMQPKKGHFTGEAECDVKGGKPPMSQHCDAPRAVAGTRGRGGSGENEGAIRRERSSRRDACLSAKNNIYALRIGHGGKAGPVIP